MYWIHLGLESFLRILVNSTRVWNCLFCYVKKKILNTTNVCENLSKSHKHTKLSILYTEGSTFYFDIFQTRRVNPGGSFFHLTKRSVCVSDYAPGVYKNQCIMFHNFTLLWYIDNYTSSKDLSFEKFMTFCSSLQELAQKIYIYTHIESIRINFLYIFAELFVVKPTTHCTW